MSFSLSVNGWKPSRNRASAFTQAHTEKHPTRRVRGASAGVLTTGQHQACPGLCASRRGGVGIDRHGDLDVGVTDDLAHDVRRHTHVKEEMARSWSISTANAGRVARSGCHQRSGRISPRLAAEQEGSHEHDSSGYCARHSRGCVIGGRMSRVRRAAPRAAPAAVASAGA